MGSSSMDLSLANIWQSWFKFRRGKRENKELELFTYQLEQNLLKLFYDLNNTGQYKHGGYKYFIVNDNKRREIRLAEIKDRIVHRLLYEHLYQIYDKIFIYDTWSCRKGKGLLSAIERTQKFLSRYSRSFVWRADIKKFFDNIDQHVLLKILSLRIKDKKELNILKEVIESYSAVGTMQERKKGIPIGNLTSQILANIYLNELDMFVKHIIRPQAYLRYGDDFIVILKKIDLLKQARDRITGFLSTRLGLEIKAKSDIIIKAKWGLNFLGVRIYSKGRKLNDRNWHRVKEKLNHKNVSSYNGLIKQHSKEKRIKEFNWLVLEKNNTDS